MQPWNQNECTLHKVTRRRASFFIWSEQKVCVNAIADCTQEDRCSFLLRGLGFIKPSPGDEGVYRSGPHRGLWCAMVKLKNTHHHLFTRHAGATTATTELQVQIPDWNFDMLGIDGKIFTVFFFFTFIRNIYSP